MRAAFLAGCLLVSLALLDAQTPAVTVQITSPLGRIGVAGTIRIVAQIHAKDADTSVKVRFLVDGKQLGVDEDGPPYAIDWLDENPLEPREIVVEATDSEGNSGRDAITLNAFEFSDTASVSSMLLEVNVQDKKGRFVGVKPGDFTLRENGAVQKLDLVTPEEVPAMFALLVDSSQSMAPRMDFVRLAARRIYPHLSKKDRVVVAPFSVGLGAVTGPTDDQATLMEAITAIRPAGGTAILESLSQTTERLKGLEGRRVIVLITDGFDENSKQSVDSTIKDLLANQITVYVVGVGGVSGVSLRGQALLRQIAVETGGRAFFPWDERELSNTYDLVAANVTNRYLIAYTPQEAVADGSWHAIEVTTPSPEHVVLTRKGFFAPKPPPIRPALEFTFPQTAAAEITDVSAGDLFVLEDGVEQAIDTFHESVAPVSIVLALDASGSMKRSTQAATDAARGFIKALRPSDQLAVLMFADKAVFTHDFSKNREQSFQAVDSYVADGGTALYDAVGTALARVKNVEGRRAIVVVTDGRDEDNPGTGPGSERSFDDVLNLLKDSGAVVFGVGIGSRVDRHPLEELAKRSGGEAYFPPDAEALSAEYQRVVENLRRRWIVGYESKNKTRDGKWRKVEIRMRSTNLLMTSLGGYFAPER